VAHSKASSPNPLAPINGRGAHVRLSASERREQLIEIALDLFSRKGFKGTTTREIASAAGVTEAIIFRHFETKEQLYTAIIDRRLNSPDTAEWCTGLLAAMDRDDDEAVIRQLIDAIIQTHKTDPKFERFMLYAALEGNEIALRHMRQVTASIVDVYREYFIRRQKQGRLRLCVPEVALTAIVGMARNYALGKYCHELKEQCLTDEQALESFTRIAMDGLRVPTPRGWPLAKKKQ
jgi:TetR/AcrR family transcriptional regulator